MRTRLSFHIKPNTISHRRVKREHRVFLAFLCVSCRFILCELSEIDYVNVLNKEEQRPEQEQELKRGVPEF